MPVSEAQRKANAKYDKEHFEYCTVKVKKGAKQMIQNIAKTNNESINGYIKKAIKAQIKADAGNDIEL